MPHKRAKRSVREAERKNRMVDLAPTSVANEPIPKGMARILDAEATRSAYRLRKAAESDKGKKANAGADKIRAGETVGEYNRRADETHRPLVRAAMKHSTEGKGEKSERGERVGGTAKRKREQTDEVKEFQTFRSSAPRRLHDVALAPPVLTSGPRGAKKKPEASMARRVMLERERERAVGLYRAHKAGRTGR